MFTCVSGGCLGIDRVRADGGQRDAESDIWEVGGRPPDEGLTDAGDTGSGSTGDREGSVVTSTARLDPGPRGWRCPGNRAEPRCPRGRPGFLFLRVRPEGLIRKVRSLLRQGVRGLCSVQEHQPSGGDRHGSRCAALGLAACCRTTVRTFLLAIPSGAAPSRGRHLSLVRWPAPTRPALAGVPLRASTFDHGVLHRPRGRRPGISQSVPDRQ